MERRIAAARELIRKDKTNARGFSDLAFALAKRFRETGNAVYLRQAEEAISESLRLAPANFDARKARVVVRLRENRFADALEEARALNQTTPDDNPLYGLIADAEFALGNYSEAEAAAQKMLDLHRVNPPALQRGAQLREVFGDAAGAREWWHSALRLTSAADTEERAWIAAHLARTDIHAGELEEADRVLAQVFAQQPDYPEALAVLAQLRMAQDRPADAVDALRVRLRQGPDLDSLYRLAQALEKTGRAEEARRAFQDFEKQAREAADTPGNSNRDLISYYADIAQNPKEAVGLARRELQKRHDVFTLDALAWALYRNGEIDEAKKRIGDALTVGTRDPGILAHAETIRAH